MASSDSEEGLPLVSLNESDDESNESSASTARRLYVSHFLSTWNSRVFEFGAVLYLATIFPGTLVPMSVYALFRGLCAVLFAPAVGLYIDTRNRLEVVRVSIVLQRVVVAASCGAFYVLLTPLSLGVRHGLLVLVTFFACVEKLTSIMNLVSVEKDWVFVIARDAEALRVLHAQMRRIDLICKLLGPLFIALIDGYSTRVAIITNFAMNAVSIVFEYFAIARVYHEAPDLHIKERTQHTSGFLTHVAKFSADFNTYFHHRAFLPSIAGAILYLTVLSFAGQMVTYLLSAGYNSTQVGVARTFSVAFEVAATWTAPWLMGRLGPVKAGLWFSWWQVATIVAGVAVFWTFKSISASGLVVGTILSRLGLFGLDLCIQYIVQEEVEAELRGAFSTVEAAWQNVFELLAYATTIVFSDPSQFKWPSLISVGAITTASVIYTIFAYRYSRVNQSSEA